MITLYPPITPYSTGFLQVSEQHQIYWEQVGAPDGIPIVFLHGGPGGGASAIHRQYFDPDHYRIIIFDQRGAGRSHPLGCLDENTPDFLISDMEHLREHLRIERWHLFGGSWGSTLALLYAAAHPAHCLSLVLHGIFLMTQDEIDWFTRHMGRIYPKAHRAWFDYLPAPDRDDPLAGYERLLTTGALIDQIAAAKAWCAYELACSAPDAETAPPRDPVDIKLYWAWARIECHYFRHHLMEAEQGLLSRLKTTPPALPLIIVQGQQDMICPVYAADALHRVWRTSEFICVENGGHSSCDRSMRKELIAATNRMRYAIPNGDNIIS